MMRPHIKSGTEGKRLCHPWQRFGIFAKKKRGEKEGLKQRRGKEREILAGWFIPQMPALAMTGPG